MGDEELQTDEAPDDIVFADQVMSVAFHPARNVVAASTVSSLALLLLHPLFISISTTERGPM